MSKSLFITGTGTDVGKTYVTALIVKKLKEYGENVAYFKAAMSGNVRAENGDVVPGDALWVKNVSGIDQKLEDMCPYVYESAVSPHLAAKLENKPIKIAVIEGAYEKLKTNYDYITLEGAGGICSPLSFDGEQLLQDEMVKDMKVPCLVVADAGLGTINSVILTASYMKNKGIKVAGIIFNNFHPKNQMEEDNIKMCEALTDLKVLAVIKNKDEDIDISLESLKSLYN